MENFFPSNPYIFVVLKVKKKSSAPGIGTKSHFLALFGFGLRPIRFEATVRLKASGVENRGQIANVLTPTPVKFGGGMGEISK